MALHILEGLRMDEPKSKSQKKRDAEFLQKLGVELISWSDSKLDLLPLSDTLRQAIQNAKKIKSHGALRRQSQLIGKLMRSSDYDAILDAYNNTLSEEKAQTASFHTVEIWRDRLIENDKNALTEFISLYSPSDVQKLKHLIKKAVDEKKNNTLKGASKALFRFLRLCIP